jgi:hypothetical protein
MYIVSVWRRVRLQVDASVFDTHAANFMVEAQSKTLDSRNESKF